MGKNKAAPPAEPEVAPGAQEAPATAAQAYTIPQLRKYCLHLFGVSPSTFDGAAHGLTGELTIDQMQESISKFLTKEVNI